MDGFFGSVLLKGSALVTFAVYHTPNFLAMAGATVDVDAVLRYKKQPWVLKGLSSPLEL
jgi:hypothetical protein